MPKKTQGALAAEVGGLQLAEVATPSPEELAPSAPDESAVPSEGTDESLADVDISAIKRRLREGQLISDSAVIAAQTANVRQWMSTLQADGSWGDIVYTDQNTGPWKTVG